MIKIFINKISLDVSIYDNDSTILERYSLLKENSLPSYFNIIEQNFNIEAGLKLQVKDVRDEIEKLKEDDFKNLNKINIILNIFSDLEKREIGYLWLLRKYTNDSKPLLEQLKSIEFTNDEIEALKHLERNTFNTSQKILANLIDYVKDNQKFINSLEERLKDKIMSTLNDIKSVNIDPFILKETFIELTFNLFEGNTLLDIFDAMETSRDIPFIYLSYKKKKYYKVLRSLPPLDIWIENPTGIKKEKDEYPDGIYFKVLSAPYSKLESKQILLSNLYSTGYWSIKNEIVINYIIWEGINENIIASKLEKSIGDRIKYKIENIKQLNIKGIFIVPLFVLNRAIFADLVSNDNIVSHFLFFNEKDQTVLNLKTPKKYTPNELEKLTLIGIKEIAKKLGIKGYLSKGKDEIIPLIIDFQKKQKDKVRPSLFAYYYPNQIGNIEKSLSILITPYIEEGVHYVSIRVSKAKNYLQANSVRLVLGKLLWIYNDRYNQIVKEYSEIIPKFKSLAEVFVKKEKVKEDLKTGKRLNLIKKFNKETKFDFLPEKNNYATQCQRHRHPYIVRSKEEADKIAEKLGSSHKVMSFNDLDLPAGYPKNVWWICEPRESGDKENHIWPGLKENTNKKNPEWKKKFPYLPCCYETDQYIKEGSLLPKLLIGKEGKKGFIVKAKETTGFGHVISKSEILKPGQYGELPFNLNKILIQMKIKKIKKGKQEFYPILRHGVVGSPDSFLHCMERAFNNKYLMLPQEEKKNRILKIRDELSKLNFSIAKQELYNYSNDEIKKILKDPNSYIDPDCFISLAQQYYDCNIFLFYVTEKSPDGNIVIPKHSQAYLFREIDPNKKTIIIVKYEAKGETFPYQCEVVCLLKIVGKSKEISFVFKDSPLIFELTSLLYKSNEVFVITPVSYQPYTIVG